MSNNILKITFDASTINGTIVNDMTYSPTMSNPQLYSMFPNILFIPSIKLKGELFDKSLGDDDIKKIFLSSAQMNNFIVRLQEEKKYEPITIESAEEKGIINNNIKFVLHLFFRKGMSFFIHQTQYVINSYNWNNKYELIPVSGQAVPIVSINLSFILHQGKKLSFVDSTRLNCMHKRESIVNDYYHLVGLDKPSGKTAKLEDQPVNTLPVARLISSPKKTVTTTTTTTYK
jgi:hypothetical protein